MLSLRHDPFPFEAVRDLLGILRAFYAATPAEHTRKRAAIETTAKSLRVAVDLALEYGPGTLGHASAWARAEKATASLADLVDVTTPLEPVIRAAAGRVTGT